MRNKNPCVYMLANKPNGTLHVGVTSNLIKRIWEQQKGLVEGFTNTHNIYRFFFYELHSTMVSAIAREKQLKKWNRAWKIPIN